MPRHHRLSVFAALVCTGLAMSMPADAASFQAVNLVTDNQAAHAAQITDAGLINAWGISYSATGPFWVSSNGTGVSTVYTVNAATQVTAKSALTVNIPGAGSVTGQAFNSAAASGAFGGNNFLFVSEDGRITGWRSALGSNAESLQLDSPNNVYKGTALATVSGSTYLYGANFHNASIDVLKGTAVAPTLLGSFVDPALPSGYAPFNIQNLGGTLYVAYAKRGATGQNEIAGAGLGYVDAFSTQGQFLARIASQGTLNAPWGLAIAPSSFGSLAGALLVGNFGDGHIGAYDTTTHGFLGQITDGGGAPLAIDGLWALTPGNGGSAGSSSLLYFSAGPDGETHGLLGVLTPVPETRTGALLALGLAALALQRRGWALRRPCPARDARMGCGFWNFKRSQLGPAEAPGSTDGCSVWKRLKYPKPAQFPQPLEVVRFDRDGGMQSVGPSLRGLLRWPRFESSRLLRGDKSIAANFG